MYKILSVFAICTNICNLKITYMHFQSHCMTVITHNQSKLIYPSFQMLYNVAQPWAHFKSYSLCNFIQSTNSNTQIINQACDCDLHHTDGNLFPTNISPSLHNYSIILALIHFIYQTKKQHDNRNKTITKCFDKTCHNDGGFLFLCMSLISVHLLFNILPHPVLLVDHCIGSCSQCYSF